MVRKIDTIAKVIKIGNSLGITISKDAVVILNLKQGDYIQISIEKIEKRKEKEQ